MHQSKHEQSISTKQVFSFLPTALVSLLPGPFLTLNTFLISLVRGKTVPDKTSLG